MQAIPSFDQLIAELAKLPSIGRKSAMRMAYYLARQPAEQVEELEAALRAMRERLTTCPVCFSMTEEQPCAICRDVRRERHRLCVVEEPMDLFAFEQSGVFRGVYHVLGGTLDPMRGVGAEELHIDALIRRIKDSHAGKPFRVKTAATPDPAATSPEATSGSADEENGATPPNKYFELEAVPIQEVILATNPDVDGEATAHYVGEEIADAGLQVSVTRLGLGLPMGGDLEFADHGTLSKALEGRRPL
jgi:recombination protein RecR